MRRCCCLCPAASGPSSAKESPSSAVRAAHAVQPAPAGVPSSGCASWPAWVRGAADRRLKHRGRRGILPRRALGPSARWDRATSRSAPAQLARALPCPSAALNNAQAGPESDRAGAQVPPGAPQQRWPLAGPRPRPSQRAEIAPFGAVRCPCRAASTCGRPQQRLRQLAGMGARCREKWRRDRRGRPSRRAWKRCSAAACAARRAQSMSCSQLRGTAATAPAGKL